MTDVLKGNSVKETPTRVDGANHLNRSSVKSQEQKVW